jgi:acetoin utilization protein AcuB
VFYVQSINGQLFNGPLEQLNRVNGLARLHRTPAIARNDEDPGAEFVMPHQENEAVQAYRQMISADLERGPLYHANQVMSRLVILVEADSTVADAWRILRDNQIHQAPVVDDKQSLIGIVSERDLLTAIDIDDGEVIVARQRQVKDVMSTPVVAAAPITDIRRIAAVMLDKGVDGVPVINEAGRIMGFVSRSDILRAVVTDPPLSLWR